MSQIPLKLVHETIQTRESFIISDANREAFSWVEQWPHWPSHCLIIYGEKHCGKTHLARIWQQKSGAKMLSPQDVSAAAQGALARCFVLEVAANITDEVALFHLYNGIKEQGGYLLLTLPDVPGNMVSMLPDLASRLQSCPAVRVQQPDDILLKSMLIKLFSDRQLKAVSEVIEYIVPRIERSFEAVHALVEEIDRKAMQDKRNITVPLVRDVLEGK